MHLANTFGALEDNPKNLPPWKHKGKGWGEAHDGGYAKRVAAANKDKGKGKDKEKERKEKAETEKKENEKREKKLKEKKAREEEIAALDKGLGFGEDVKGVLEAVVGKEADEEEAPQCVEYIAFSSFNPVPGRRR